jgi:hypothetical protein
MARGGKRAGAGRKPDAERHAEAAAKFADSCSKYLAKTFGFLSDLAEGGTRTQRTYQAAGTLLRRTIVRNDDGTPWLDDKGKPAVEFVATTDVAGDQLVLTREVVTNQPPDFRALELIVDRCMGTPRPSPEVAADMLEIRRALADVEARIAARKAAAPSPSPPADDATSDPQ